MATPLDSPIKREVRIEDDLYTLTLDGEGVTLVRKGGRKGFTVTWASLVEGSPQRQLDLMRSIEALQPRKPEEPAGPRPAPRGAAGKRSARRST